MQSREDENLKRESDDKYRHLFELSPLPKWFYDLETYRFLDVNKAALNLYGYSREEFLDLTILDIRPERDIQKVREAHNNLTEGTIQFGVFTHLTKEGEPMKMEITGRRMFYAGRDCMMIIANNVTESYKKDQLESLERQFMEQAIAADASLGTTLSNYLKGLENLFDGMHLTVLQVKNGRVYHLAAPSMPREYSKAIDGLGIGPSNGSCGTAAYLKQTVIVENIEVAEEWQDYKDLITPFGYKASWAQPVFDSEQNVIATFAIYYKTVRSPSEQELELLDKNASLFSIILENHQKKSEIEKSNERYEYVTKATFDAIWDFDILKSHVKWGDSYEEIFGLIDYPNLNERDKVIARLHPEEREDIIANAAETLKGESNEWSLEHRYLKSDGSYAHVVNRGIIIREKNGQPVRAIGAMQDVTKERAERKRLQLIESVITNTSDAVLITEANPVQKPGPKIVYANDAFEESTGYTSEEVIGKTPRILQGPKTDRKELDRLLAALVEERPFSTTLVNYRKDGSEFWNDISINPVKSNQGEVTHFVAIQRDVTRQKNEEIQKKLITEISAIFNRDIDLVSSVQKVLKHLVNFGSFSLAEIWEMNEDRTHLDFLTSYTGDTQIKGFYRDSANIKKFEKGEGLPGTVWQEMRETLWEEIDKKEIFIRREAARVAGLKEVLGVPLFRNEKLVGVIVFGSKQKENELSFFKSLFPEVGKALAGEIQRKKLEEELSLLFSNSPDILCIAGPDGYFKRVNPAFSELLGYSQEEITSIPFVDLIHPEDRESTNVEYADTIKGERRAIGFENRYRTKDGDYKWISWNSSDLFKEEGYAFAYGRDVTEKKELEDLLENATELASLGFWEVDVINDSIYWSPMVCKLHEVPEGYQPNLDEAIQFYRVESQEIVKKYIEDSISSGKDFSFELPIVTAKGNDQWIKCIGKAESRYGKVIKIFGSFQDVHQRKEAELRLLNTANNFPGVIFKYYVYPDGRDELKFVSEGSRNIWQLTPEECMQSTDAMWSQVKNQEEAEGLQKAIEHSAATQTQFYHQWQITRPDGKTIWIEGRGSPTRLSDGTNVWDTVLLDISEKKELEDLVDRANKMAKIGTWENTFTKDNEEMYWSPMTREIIEVDESYDPTLTGGFEFYEEKSREKIENALKRLVTYGEEFDLELLIYTAKGTPKWVRCLGEADRRNGETVKIFGSIQDIHERKMAELALSESEARLQGIMASQSHYIIRTDLEGKYSFYNKKFYEDFGWTHGNKDLIGVSGMDSIMDYHHPKVGEIVEKCIVSPNTVFQVEIDKPRKGGGVVTTLWDFVCLPDSDGNPSEIQCSGVDISDRIAAEKALQNMYNEKVEVLESIGDGFFSVDQNWIVTYWNSRAEEMLQTPKQKILNKNLWDVFEEAKNMLFYEMYHRALEEQVTVNFDEYFAPLQRWYQVSAYPSKNGLAVYFKDITERKKYEEQLKLSNERFEKVSEATSDAIWDWDVKEDTLFWGKGFQSSFGYEIEKFSPTTEAWLEHIHKSDRAEVEESFSAAVKDANVKNWKMDYRFRYQSGGFAYVEDRGMIIRDEKGEATRVVGVMSDISKRKEYEKSLKDLNASLKKQARELRLSNVELEQFAYVASHDLQEPLRMVTSFLSQLEKRYSDKLDEKAQKYIFFAVDGAKRMREIILDLLDFSRVGHYDAPPTKVDIAELIDEVKALHRKSIEEKRAKVVMTTQMPEVLGQRSPLLQVFQNLISNSLKYSRENVPPKIEISAEKSGNEWIFQLKDNGIGISEESYEDIFVIFQRLHAKGEFEGTGMGLAIVKKIIESFDGRIWLESEEGKGTTFFFTIPIREK
ncbi:PAS domain S-box protein [Halocola ammonii]